MHAFSAFRAFPTKCIFPENAFFAEKRIFVKNVVFAEKPRFSGRTEMPVLFDRNARNALPDDHVPTM